VRKTLQDSIISVEGLSKRYILGHVSTQRSSATLRDTIQLEASNFARKVGDLVRGRQILEGDQTEEFWALKDVSFEVKRGEVVGIIGRNGAGKSTLLKILSRITEPTEGMVRLRGRIASLLEVGTGFHPELTGRENIFLNGSILGMTQHEIRRKFDEIVAFAEIDRFIDTPVKRYSSGMYVRLAFAVAAHLEPEVLVVDEVLAVGDVEFQRKCLGKMGEIAGDGRTVLLVSHNTHAIRALCDSAIALDKGQLIYFGNTDKAIQLYNGSFARNGDASRVTVEDKARSVARDSRIKLRAIRFKGSGTAILDEEFCICIEVEVYEPMTSVVFGLGFGAKSGARLLSCDSDYSGRSAYSLAPGLHDIECTFGQLPLAPGEYVLDVGCRSEGLVMYDEIKEACVIEVVPPRNASPQLLQKYSTCMFKASWTGAPHANA
jgi:lipopolysaccharide transport system ATP-binding protein